MTDHIMQIKNSVDVLLRSGRQIIVAIDGCCTAGKTTLAAILEKEYDCNVFHMDDFFLRPDQRTAERYEQPGGNVDYERFRQEILLKLQEKRAFSYRPFDCSSLSLTEPIEVIPKQLNIIEGTYSHHPEFGNCYDLKIFLSVHPELQATRILQRPQWLHRRFFQEWIPMEQTYFSHFQIREHADIRLDLSHPTEP